MHVTAKPSSFQCNLKCDYCFYLEKESQFTHEKWMDDSTLKEFIKQYIAASGNQVYFTWQGGEPTLAGLDFFRKVIHYQQRYAGQKRIFNALQTNGILLNNEWCAFLKEHEFLVGISIDGPQELHDRYRRSNSGNGTFAKVIAAIERLKSYQVEFNTLTVINNVNVHYPLEVYHFLKSIGSKHMQFIELLETGTPNIDFSGHSENTFRIIDFSVPPTAYGKFMSGFAPIFPDICYHLTHYRPAAADIPVASDNPVHYADAIRYNARTPLQGSLLPLTRLVWA